MNGSLWIEAIVDLKSVVFKIFNMALYKSNPLKFGLAFVYLRLLLNPFRLLLIKDYVVMLYCQ